MGEHEIKLLVDPGSNNTVLSSKLNDKVDMEYQGSALLEINAAAECKAITKGEMYLLKLSCLIPWCPEHILHGLSIPSL